MKIKRVVTAVTGTSEETVFTLNGHKIWIGHRIQEAGIHTIEKIRGAGFRSKFYKLLLSIVEDKPGVIVDLKDPEMIELLKLTECIE